MRLELTAEKMEGQEASASLKAGETLDHYLIDALVARTALTTIFCGTNLVTGRKVAIKVPHADLTGDPDFYDRFRREEKIGRKLHHPGVIRVLCDANRSKLYMVTEWVEGQSLRDIITGQGRLWPERAARLAADICDALYYVHSCGVVHRDLKPENVLVCAGDRIKLIDFGTAIAGGAQRMALARLSETAGTPDYISPEEVKGIRGDARSDIYALGVMLFEMLTGITPFEGCNPLAIMNSRLLSDPVPVRSIAAIVPTWLEEIVCRALQRDPRRRYTSAFEFGYDLRSQGKHATAKYPESEKNKSPFGWFRRTG